LTKPEKCAQVTVSRCTVCTVCTQSQPMTASLSAEMQQWLWPSESRVRTGLARGSAAVRPGPGGVRPGPGGG
jgi:hypothetical protein